MKKCFIFLFCSYGFLAAQASDRLTVEEYVDGHQEIAVREMYRTGIPASIKLGQAILESDAGNSELSKNSNNHFGIKCKKEWTGDTYLHFDDDRNRKGQLIKSCFRVYPSVEDSYIDHSEFLKTRDRYAFLFAYHQTDYKQWAYGLKAAGYATAKKYSEKLIRIIETYDLQRFDTYPNPLLLTNGNIKPTFGEGENATILGGKIDVEAAVEIPINAGKPTLSEPFTNLPAQPSIIRLFPEQNEATFLINDVEATLSRDRTLEHLAGEYDIKLKRLLKYNDLSSPSEDLLFGQYIFLGKKKKSFKGETNEHIVKRGETMYSIAQLYGVRLKNLYKRNRMKKGEQPLVGETIVLKGKAKKPPLLHLQ